MGDSSAKKLSEFIPRSVRYVIRPEDNRVIRFAKKRLRKRSYHSDIVNVSETGMLFTIDRSELLKKDELVMVQFKGPALGEIATYAKVVRTERFEEWNPRWGKRKKFRVAIQFEDMYDGLNFELRQGITDRISSQIREQKKERLKARRSWILKNYKMLLGLVFVSIGFLAINSFMSLIPRISLYLKSLFF